jgi:hypothetical protein
MAEFFAYLPVDGIFVKEKARTIPVQTVPHPVGVQSGWLGLPKVL